MYWYVSFRCIWRSVRKRSLVHAFHCYWCFTRRRIRRCFPRRVIKKKVARALSKTISYFASRCCGRKYMSSSSPTHWPHVRQFLVESYLSMAINLHNRNNTYIYSIYDELVPYFESARVFEFSSTVWVHTFCITFHSLSRIYDRLVHFVVLIVSNLAYMYDFLFTCFTYIVDVVLALCRCVVVHVRCVAAFRVPSHSLVSTKSRASVTCE